MQRRVGSRISQGWVQPRASDHWGRACLQAPRLCAGRSRKKWQERRAPAPAAASEQAGNVAQRCLEPWAELWAQGRQNPSWVLHLLHQHVGARWRGATRLPVSSRLERSPRALCPARAVGCNCSFGKILGNLSCNCPKRLLPFEIRLEPMPCHPGICACAPLTRICYTTNPLM